MRANLKRKKIWFYNNNRVEEGPHDLLKGDVSGIFGDATLIYGDVTSLRGDVTGIEGDVSDLCGDVTGIEGDVTGIKGDATGIEGNINYCELSAEDRYPGVDIADLLLDNKKSKAEKTMMNMMKLSDPVIFPEQFKETCEQFLAQYWSDRQFEMMNVFGVHDLPLVENVNQLMVADSLLQIAQAADGQVDRLEKEIVYEHVQSLCEHLFAAPGIGATYSIPNEFWEAPIGQMVALAFVWIQGDELITMTEAAEISGKSVSSLSQLVDRKKLTSYPDPNESNPRRRNRLLRSEIENLVKED